jgi:hypothetical protein
MSTWYDRPLLYDIWVQFHFRSDDLSKEAGVEEEVILSLFLGCEVKREVAETVLAALSRLTGQQYSLETVRINLDQEEMRRESKPERIFSRSSHI